MRFDKLFFLSFLFFIVAVLPLVESAISVNIDIDESFSVGDRINFNYTIISDTGERVVYFAHVICSDAPVAFIREKSNVLQAGVPLKEIYYDLDVSEEIDSQDCSAYVQVSSPVKEKFSSDFLIESSSSFDLDLIMSKKVFVVEEEVFLDYRSDVEDLSLVASLTYPDGNVEQIDFSGKNKMDVIGVYSLKVEASKEGYNDVVKIVEFAVIEKRADISGVSGFEFSSSNEPESFQWADYLNVYIVAGVLIVLVVIGLIVFFSTKKRRVHKRFYGSF